MRPAQQVPVSEFLLVSLLASSAFYVPEFRYAVLKFPLLRLVPAPVSEHLRSVRVPSKRRRARREILTSAPRAALPAGRAATRPAAAALRHGWLACRE